MGKQALFLIAAVTLLTVNSLAAADVSVWARTYGTCGYWSTTHGDVALAFHDKSLPWGSRVFVKYGKTQLGNYDETRWANVQEKEIFASAPYTWAGEISRILLVTRGSRDYFNAVDFVFRIILPGGQEYFETGSGNRFGPHFRTMLNHHGLYHCVDKRHHTELPYARVSVLRID